MLGSGRLLIFTQAQVHQSELHMLPVCSACCSSKVGQYSLQELQSHDWPQGHRVLTVQQALAAAVPHAEQVIIDAKAAAVDEVRVAVQQLLLALWLQLGKSNEG